MNIYEKINQVKLNILKSNIKKSGKNSFAKFEYYELSDITPIILSNCEKLKLFTHISFEAEKATLTIINIENTSEKLEYTSPVVELELKGCNKIQALGGAETYLRRYLYLIAFDIVEPDLFDATTGNKDFNELKINNFNELKQTIINSQDIEEIKKIYVNSKIKLTNEEKEEIQKLVNDKKEFLK